MTAHRLALAAAMVLFMLAPWSARAQDVSAADAEAFRDIISSQIEAFRADDGARAFAFASPFLQSKFVSADIFMSMVREQYPPVYRPQSFRFGAITEDLGPPTQKVHLIGPDGAAWTALYAMQRQDDGTWLISACVLLREEGVGA